MDEEYGTLVWFNKRYMMIATQDVNIGKGHRNRSVSAAR
jgi:hypothetical protein